MFYAECQQTTPYVASSFARVALQPHFPGDSPAPVGHRNGAPGRPDQAVDGTSAGRRTPAIRRSCVIRLMCCRRTVEGSSDGLIPRNDAMLRCKPTARRHSCGPGVRVRIRRLGRDGSCRGRGHFRSILQQSCIHRTRRSRPPPAMRDARAQGSGPEEGARGARSARALRKQRSQRICGSTRPGRSARFAGPTWARGFCRSGRSSRRGRCQGLGRGGGT
jgi:hypothetical protein